jgi:hypothetical protein
MYSYDDRHDSELRLPVVSGHVAQVKSIVKNKIKTKSLDFWEWQAINFSLAVFDRCIFEEQNKFCLTRRLYNIPKNDWLKIILDEIKEEFVELTGEHACCFLGNIARFGDPELVLKLLEENNNDLYINHALIFAAEGDKIDLVHEILNKFPYGITDEQIVKAFSRASSGRSLELIDKIKSLSGISQKDGQEIARRAAACSGRQGLVLKLIEQLGKGSYIGEVFIECVRGGDVKWTNRFLDMFLEYIDSEHQGKALVTAFLCDTLDIACDLIQRCSDISFKIKAAVINAHMYNTQGIIDNQAAAYNLYSVMDINTQLQLCEYFVTAKDIFKVEGIYDLIRPIRASLPYIFNVYKNTINAAKATAIITEDYEIPHDLSMLIQQFTIGHITYIHELASIYREHLLSIKDQIGLEIPEDRMANVRESVDDILDFLSSTLRDFPPRVRKPRNPISSIPRELSPAFEMVPYGTHRFSTSQIRILRRQPEYLSIYLNRDGYHREILIRYISLRQLWELWNKELSIPLAPTKRKRTVTAETLFTYGPIRVFQKIRSVLPLITEENDSDGMVFASNQSSIMIEELDNEDVQNSLVEGDATMPSPNLPCQTYNEKWPKSKIAGYVSVGVFVAGGAIIAVDASTFLSVPHAAAVLEFLISGSTAAVIADLAIVAAIIASFSFAAQAVPGKER